MADADAGDQVAKALSREELLKDHTFKVLESYLPYDYENSAVDISLTGVHKYKAYKDIAAHIKREYDSKYPGSGKATEGVYHCICGKNFASELSLLTIAPSETGRRKLSISF